MVWGHRGTHQVAIGMRMGTTGTGQCLLKLPGTVP